MEPDPRLVLPPSGETKLIRSPSEHYELTDRRETDCRTALTRGLTEYLRTLSIDWVGGNQTRLVRVFHTWSAPEVVAEFPSAAVYATALGEYQAHNFTQNTDFIPGTGYAARKASEYVVPLRVECWTTNQNERMALAAMLEQAFEPNDWKAGFRLHLPHYHGCVGTYLKTDNDYRDGEDSRTRIMLVTFDLIASVDQIAFVGKLPPFRPSAELAVDDGAGGTAPRPKRVGSR